GARLKRILLGVVLAALAGTARAETAVYNWAGCYVGVHAGGGVLFDGYVFMNGGGAIAGGQIGCNVQTGPLVFGLEAEGSWSNLVAKRNIVTPVPSTEHVSSRSTTHFNV